MPSDRQPPDDSQSFEPSSLDVALDGFIMRLRPSELTAVAASFAAPGAPGPMRLAEALRGMPTSDRAPVWELAVRHFGRRKPLEQAAGEIGMDVLHARDLLAAFQAALVSTRR